MTKDFHKINLKDFNLPSTKRVEKAISHINDKGDLIKNKYYDVRIDENEPIETYMITDADRGKRKSKSKAKRKTKGCGCK